jgi:hypothetical protein
MGWPLRMFQEEGFYFVTSRRFHGWFLLCPSQEVNEVVSGVLARAVQQSAGTVRLHAFTFASLEGVARAVPLLRRGVPKGGGAVAAGRLVGEHPSLFLPSACRAGSRRSSSLIPSPATLEVKLSFLPEQSFMI